MDGVEAALAGVGALVLAAPLGRAVAAAARRGARAGASASAAVSDAAGAVGARGALAAGLGLATAVAGTASASPATALAASSPAAGRPVPPAPRTGPAIPARAAAPAVHVVEPGECLWSIAAARLGPGATDAAIAREWPRWYRANRGVIGPDPGLLLVGTPLQVPFSRTTGRRTGTSAQQHPAPAQDRPSAPAAPSPDPGEAGSLDPDRR